MTTSDRVKWYAVEEDRDRVGVLVERMPITDSTEYAWEVESGGNSYLVEESILKMTS